MDYILVSPRQAARNAWKVYFYWDMLAQGQGDRPPGPEGREEGGAPSLQGYKLKQSKSTGEESESRPVCSSKGLIVGRAGRAAAKGRQRMAWYFAQAPGCLISGRHVLVAWSIPAGQRRATVVGAAADTTLTWRGDAESRVKCFFESDWGRERGGIAARPRSS